MGIARVLSQADAGRQGALDRLFALLRIESISTDSVYETECQRAAEWLAADLKSIGFETELKNTPGKPVVLAHGGEGDRHFLFYGHYDVQPVDPIDLWDNPPFEPAIEKLATGDVIRARGVADDKGQLMTFVEACRTIWQAEGRFPCRITLLLEGEEEIGSPSLAGFISAHAKQLKADYAFVCDTSMVDAETPSITTMLRGLCGIDFSIRAADRDLHSGQFGGPAINPLRVMSKLLAGLHDDTGRITLPGFYDDVPQLPEDQYRQWKKLAAYEAGLLPGVGLSVPAGERDRSVLEQNWSRPTCDINGLWGGYCSPGFKTVLPAEAHAKVSFRLVGRQDPAKIAENFCSYVEQELPADCTAIFHDSGGYPAAAVPIDSELVRNARDALSEEWGKQAIFIGSGVSVPVVGHFRTLLGMDSLMTGFRLDDDQIHSPNEKYRVNSYFKGIRSWARILYRLSATAQTESRPNSP